MSRCRGTGVAKALAPRVRNYCRPGKEKRPWVSRFLGPWAAGENRHYLFKWSRRKRKVTRLASGRDSSKLSMQLSFATGSERATERGSLVSRVTAQARELS